MNEGRRILDETDDDAAPGGCLCRRIRFRVPPKWVIHCHCRRNTGAAVATFVGVEEGHFEPTAGAPGEYASSPGVRRGFRAECGTPLTYRADRFPGEVHLCVSTFDAPERFPPQAHVYEAERIP